MEENLALRTYTVEELAALDMSTKLRMMHEGLVNTYLMHLQTGSLHPRDMAPMMTLLKNNDIKEEDDKEMTMHDKVRAALDKESGEEK